MKRLISAFVVGVAIFVLSACATATPLPPGSDSFPTEAAASAAVPAAKAKAPAAPKASTCDVVKEAFLTGTPAEITASLKALVKDKTADATAREYAQYYVGRDKGNKQMQEMDISLIQMSCL